MFYITRSEAETEALGARTAKELLARFPDGAVFAMFGGLGMGKTAFVRGMAIGLGLDAEVSSPTFALVNDYGPLVHFDMYRLEGTDEADLASTGFYDYLEAGRMLAVEWSEHIEDYLPPGTVRAVFEKLGDDTRKIIITGDGYENTRN